QRLTKPVASLEPPWPELIDHERVRIGGVHAIALVRPHEVRRQKPPGGETARFERGDYAGVKTTRRFAGSCKLSYPAERVRRAHRRRRRHDEALAREDGQRREDRIRRRAAAFCRVVTR